MWGQNSEVVASKACLQAEHLGLQGLQGLAAWQESTPLPKKTLYLVPEIIHTSKSFFSL